MREYVKTIARFFRVRPVEVLCLLDEIEADALGVESMVNSKRMVWS